VDELHSHFNILNKALEEQIQKADLNLQQNVTAKPELLGERYPSFGSTLLTEA